MKRGFSLIEIIVALALAALLTIALYTSFEQTRRSTKKIEAMTDKSAHLMLLYAQLERDFTAATVPQSFLVEQKTTSTVTSTPQQASKEEKGVMDPDKIKKIFNVTIQGQEKELSFITTSSLLGYQEIKQRLVRVIYRIVPSGNSFMITRQEVADIEQSVKEFEKDSLQAIPLLEGIKKMDMVYVIIENEKGKQEKQELSAWDNAKKEEIKHLLPNYIIFKGIVENHINHQEHAFTFVYELPAAIMHKKPEKKDKKTAQGPAKTPAPPPPLPPPTKR